MRGIRVLRDRHRIPGPGNLAIITSASDEELEATAKLFLLLRNEKVRCLTPAQVAQLRKKHPV